MKTGLLVSEEEDTEGVRNLQWNHLNGIVFHFHSTSVSVKQDTDFPVKTRTSSSFSLTRVCKRRKGYFVSNSKKSLTL